VSLIYRAIWQDDGLTEACATARDTFAAWVSQKWSKVEVPADGRVVASTNRRGERVDLEVSVTAAGDESVGIPAAYRADLVETYQSGARWHTTLRAWHHQNSEPAIKPEKWMWIDVEVVGDDISRIASAAPGVVNDLLAAGVSPDVDGDRLMTGPSPVVGYDAGEKLADVISRQDRTLPLIVINDNATSRGRAALHDLYLPDVVGAIHRAAAGIAVVHTVDNAAAKGIIAGLGRSHGIWDGAMRVYLPDVDPAAPNNEWRHRYFTADRYAGSKAVARRAIGRLLGPVSAVRRPPDCYPTVKRVLERGSTDGDTDALLELADEQLREADITAAELREQIEARDESLEGLAIDLAVATEDQALLLERVEKLERHVASLQSQLSESDAFYEVVGADEPPATVGSLSEAASQAMTFLGDRLVIPMEALHQLDELDAAPTSVAWGQTSWEGFRALHAYAVDRAHGWSGGGFWEWCENSGNLRVWRASEKKLAMVESASVNNSPKLRQARMFPVSTEVDPSGIIYMQAHLKIATGGGNLAPRIYFHFDDQHCRTHVGFFGPHKLVPNTKT
jgi:hypothetical protein